MTGPPDHTGTVARLELSSPFLGQILVKMSMPRTIERLLTLDQFDLEHTICP